ncbi:MULTISPECIES: hypothetical protein [Acinetobacter]|jgi:uncharacterized protein Yka (UPF0111/DUF47 family)|uniref:Uncharacterized protein n=1 Tax=Acinetobacter schindleri TaxID=108981 RepID=A0AAE6WVP7_9GAMM|nr:MULTISPECIES: hypothetical protein [Acinetobacter]EIM39789.1 hypothetical protein HADU_04780 [Acinetobacter sp. HA]MCK8640299.1 hypothetical protein [Acinetobacter schindleri]QIC62311.1 hypothetical protein FSC12_13880 [Acinetobacter schindleri]QIC63939.1 hypothetical protein FSC11_06025 [Acinetobacter schindleri]QIC66966.1 hypothetical protein FSC10_06150 [Acinetobacter schindleri]
MKTREQKLLEQNHELEKIADQLEQQTLQKQYNSASSWNWMARLDGVDIVELASEMVDTVEELLGD